MYGLLLNVHSVVREIEGAVCGLLNVRAPVVQLEQPPHAGRPVQPAYLLHQEQISEIGVRIQIPCRPGIIDEFRGCRSSTIEEDPQPLSRRVRHHLQRYL